MVEILNEESLEAAAESSIKAKNIEKLLADFAPGAKKNLRDVRLFIGQSWEYLGGFEDDERENKVNKAFKDFLELFVKEKREEAKEHLEYALTDITP